MNELIICILNWNGKEHLSYSIPSIVSSCGDKKIPLYVIDNNSSDGSIGMLEEKYPSVNIIQNGSNLGYANGFNKGIEKIAPEHDQILVLANNDIKVPNGWFTYPMQLFRENHDIAALGFSIVEKESELIMPVSIENKLSLKVSGCFYMVRYSCFKYIGGFDETYYMYGEENDLFYRMQRMGYKMVVCTIPIYHYFEGSSSKKRLLTSYLSYRNRFYFCFSNLMIGEAFRSIAALVLIAVSPILPKKLKTSRSIRRERPYNILFNTGLLLYAFIWNLTVVNKILKKRKSPVIIRKENKYDG